MLLDSGLPAEQVMDSLSAFLASGTPEDWRDAYLESWQQNKSVVLAAVQRITGDNPVSILGKAREVSFGHERVLQECRIFTSVRPVFNASGDKIVQMVITNELILDYRHGARRERIELSMDCSKRLI